MLQHEKKKNDKKKTDYTNAGWAENIVVFRVSVATVF